MTEDERQLREVVDDFDRRLTALEAKMSVLVGRRKAGPGIVIFDKSKKAEVDKSRE